MSPHAVSQPYSFRFCLDFKAKKSQEFGQYRHMGVCAAQVGTWHTPATFLQKLNSSPGKPGCISQSSADGELAIGVPCAPDLL